jgi:hypothetical protein
MSLCYTGVRNVISLSRTLPFHTTLKCCRYSAVFHEEQAWDASAAWFTGEVAESERTGDGTYALKMHGLNFTQDQW